MLFGTEFCFTFNDLFSVYLFAIRYLKIINKIETYLELKILQTMAYFFIYERCVFSQFFLQ